MKSIIRFGVVAVVFALLTSLISGVGVPVRAQGGAPNFCFDLKADDCKLITDGVAAVAKITSANFNWALNIKTGGTPEATTLDVSGKGSFAAPAGGSASAPSGGNPMGAVMNGLASAQFQTSVSSKGTMGPQDLAVELELRVINNTLYLKSDKLTAGKWMGIKLDEAASTFAPMMSSMTGMAGGAGGAG